MYICVCKAVSDSTITAAVDRGVRSMRELVRETGCGSQCGRCAQAVRETLNDALRREQPSFTLSLVTSARAA